MMMESEWRTEKLGELVVFKTGKLDSNASVPDGDYPFFTCSQETFRTNTFSFDVECVVLAGNNANGIFPLKYFHGKFDAYQRTYVITTRDASRLNIKFLYYALRLKLSEFRSFATGAATKFLTMTILNDTEIVVPPLPVQRRIAGILSAYDELIENSQRRIRLLEDMARALYREWFVHFRFPLDPSEALAKEDGHESVPRLPSALGDIPQGWEVKKLGDILELNYGKALKKDDRREGEFPVFGSSGQVGTHDTSLVKGPGIIVGRKGNVGSVFWCDEDFYVIDTAYFVSSALPLRFLFYVLPTLNFINSDAAVPGLSRNQAYTLEVAVPPADLLMMFCELAESFERQASTLRRQIHNLRRTRDLLLPRMLNGCCSIVNT
ncbi:MAG: restriction endonuclease subunit S [Verrucomicrobiaceae bacterium]|nr:restriction endonuclease subunit S [Verrucomicrobiaceae bacterium]